MEISKHLKYWEDKVLSEVQQIDVANAYNGNIKALKVLRRQRSFRGTSNRCGKCIVIKHSSCNEKRGIIRKETSLEDGRLALWSVML